MNYFGWNPIAGYLDVEIAELHGTSEHAHLTGISDCLSIELSARLSMDQIGELHKGSQLNRAPRLAASTKDLYHGSIAHAAELEASKSASNNINKEDRMLQESNYFKSTQWYIFYHCTENLANAQEFFRSSDGSTILTSSADNILRSFIQ